MGGLRSFFLPHASPCSEFSQLRPGDKADFCGPASGGVWVSVSLIEASLYGTELHLEIILTKTKICVSTESPDQRWAMFNDKATGQFPPGAAAVPELPIPDSAEIRALEEAAVARVLQTDFKFRLELPLGHLLDARHRLDGQWYQVCGVIAVVLRSGYLNVPFPSPYANCTGHGCGREACGRGIVVSAQCSFGNTATATGSWGANHRPGKLR